MSDLRVALVRYGEQPAVDALASRADGSILKAHCTITELALLSKIQKPVTEGTKIEVQNELDVAGNRHVAADMIQPAILARALEIVRS